MLHKCWDPQDSGATVRDLARETSWGPISHRQSIPWQNWVPWADDIYVILLSPLVCWNPYFISSLRPVVYILGDLEKVSVLPRWEGAYSHFNTFFRLRKMLIIKNSTLLKRI